MGVPGLWDLLRPAATRTSLSTLAREAFYSNKNGRRALTIGIDASIWIFHAQVPQYGENPFMRTIFFKITSLLQHPVLPVFVFDGPKKPSRKRGSKVAGQFGTSDYRSRQFKELLDACGLEWWNAPGEAEAELALMSRQGKIDVVLSDDVDALLFGATCLLRNNSPTLSGAQASSTQSNSSKPDLRHYEMYRSSAIVKQWTDREGTSLKTEEDCRMAMVWIALLGGGDYAPEGLTGFGPTITYALANAGMADFLHRYKAGRPVNEVDVAKVHSLMIDQLRTNASGHLGRRYPARAAELQVKDPSTLFPAFALDAYLRPATSPDDLTQGWPGFGNGEAVYQKRGKARTEGRGDMEGFAKACEKFFEWGTKELVAKKFASESVGLFGSELVTCARERVRLKDPTTTKAKDREMETGDAARGSHITSFFQSTSGPSRSTARPNKPRKSFQDMPAHVIKIHSSRQDPTNPDLKELRISFTSTAYIKRCHDVMDGHRMDPKDLEESERATLGLVDKDGAAEKGDAPTQKAEVRLWIAEYLVQEAWPELIQAHEEELAAKSKPKTKAKKVVKKITKETGGENSAAFKSFFTQTQTQTQIRRPTQTQRASSPEEEEEPLEHRPSIRRTSTLTPPPPSSPLPSRERIKSNVRRSPPSSTTTSSSSRQPTSASGRNDTKGSESSPRPPSPRRGPRRSARFSKQAKASNDVIDLCSSDDEPTPPPPPSVPVIRRPLASTSRTNSSPAPTTKSKSKPRSISTKSKTDINQTQSLLGLPAIKPISTVLPEPLQAKEVVVKDNKKKKEKSPLYLVTYEDDEVVEIDVRGRWARGESVGVWEDVDTAG